MTGPDRIEEPTSASLGDLHERLGYASCEFDLVQRRLEDLQKRKLELLHQTEAVVAEVEQLRCELLERLHGWGVLDGLQQRVDALAPSVAKLEAVRNSMIYKLTAVLLKGINLARWLLTLRWLVRRESPEVGGSQ